MLQLTAGGDRVKKFDSVGTYRTEGSCQARLEAVGSDGGHFDFAIVVIGFPAVGIVTGVVSSRFVVIVIVEHRRAVLCRLKVKEQVRPLRFVPSERLLSRTGVNRRAGSRQNEIVVVAVVCLSANVSTITSQNEVLNGSSFFPVCHIFQSLFGNEQLVLATVVAAFFNFFGSDRLGRTNCRPDRSEIDATG